MKYSGVGQFAVELSGVKDRIHLVISDAGTGFDVEKAKRNRGLGLVSMQERVHLARGQVQIDSRPGAGTRIIVMVPRVPPVSDQGDEQTADLTRVG
jgi:signal transduction histidine kinase